MAQDECFCQVDRSQEISIYIVIPYPMSELERPVLRLLPSSETDASSPWINVWVVNFGPADIPDLESFLDSLISNLETDMPKSNDGPVDRIITRGGRPVLDRRL